MDQNNKINTAGTEAEVSAKDKSLILTLIMVLFVVGAMAVVGFIFIKPAPDTVQGVGEATEVRISGKLPGRVAEIYVKEGAEVKAGDTLVHIHSSLVEARLVQAEAMEGVSQATSHKVDAGTRKQIIASAKDLLDQASAAVGIAKKTYDRMENLFAKGVISEQKRDEAKAAYKAAKAGESAARSQYELALAGPQAEDKQVAEGMVKVAQGSVEEVGALLEDQYLTAPADGVITVIYPNVSELVATGAPIMNLQLADGHAVFNVRETLLKDIKEGTRIKVKIPALDKEEIMTVYYIRDLGTYANWQATKSTGDYDARTFQIKARPEKKIENFRPGMSVLYEGLEK